MPRVGASIVPAEVQPTRVLFIGGLGRNGSTLLARLLGEVPGFVCCGELRFVWRRGFVRNETCGCGDPFHECIFWSEVERRWRSEVDSSPEEALALAQVVERYRRLPAMLLRGLSGSRFRAVLHRYSHLQGALYRAIGSVSGARVVIDASKAPLHALGLKVGSDLEVDLVHLVRDSRAVTHSWQRARLRMEDRPDAGLMPQYHPSKSALAWTLANVVMEILSHSYPYVRVRYEDFVHDPAGSLERLLSSLGYESVPLPFVSGQEVTIGVHHTVAGNPSRFRQGPVALVLDDEWQQGMSMRQKSLVSAMTFPLLSRYGYPVLPRRRSTAARRKGPIAGG